MNFAIVIPARFGSTRFPGKPLAMISGLTMIERVIRVAQASIEGRSDTKILVATDHVEVHKVAKLAGAEVVMTGEAETGSDRVLKAISKAKYEIDYVINLQGDAPLTPPKILKKMIAKIESEARDIEVLTPVVNLTWEELDSLREMKEKSASSGTTVIRDTEESAIWFSKNVIPMIRKEDRSERYSPILKHIGIYGFRIDILEKFVSWPRTYYEKLEELEQLRILENGIKIKLLDVTDIGHTIGPGIDTREDLAFAEAIIKQKGEIF